MAQVYIGFFTNLLSDLEWATPGPFLRGLLSRSLSHARVRGLLLRMSVTPKQVCLLNYKKGDRPFWNQFFLAPIHDASGVVEYYLGIQSDVTEEVESARLARTHLEGQ